MNSKLISVKDVSKVFKVGEENFTALRDINLEIDSGSFMSFVGPSGSGKTTILNLIGGLDVPTAGNIFFKNTLKTEEGADIDGYIKRISKGKSDTEEDIAIEEIVEREDSTKPRVVHVGQHKEAV